MSGLDELFSAFAETLTKVLPTSPFTDVIASFAGMPYMSWLNWFIPVDKILGVMVAWLSAIGIFYLYSIIMRWLRVIGD